MPKIAQSQEQDSNAFDSKPYACDPPGRPYELFWTQLKSGLSIHISVLSA